MFLSVRRTRRKNAAKDGRGDAVGSVGMRQLRTFIRGTGSSGTSASELSTSCGENGELSTKACVTSGASTILVGLGVVAVAVLPIVETVFVASGAAAAGDVGLTKMP